MYVQCLTSFITLQLIPSRWLDMEWGSQLIHCLVIILQLRTVIWEQVRVQSVVLPYMERTMWLPPPPTEKNTRTHPEDGYGNIHLNSLFTLVLITLLAPNYVIYKSNTDLLQQFTNQMQRVTLSSSSPSPSGAVSVSSPSGSTSLPVLLITLLASSSLPAASRRVNKPEPKKNIARSNYQSLTAILFLWLTMP